MFTNFKPVSLRILNTKVMNSQSMPTKVMNSQSMPTVLDLEGRRRRLDDLLTFISLGN